MPSGVELESAENVCQAVLGKAAGQYGGDSGTLRIFAVDSRMVLTDNAGKVTLRTVLRVGRRAGVLVLVTEAGSVLEFAPDGVIRFGVVTYKRVP